MIHEYPITLNIPGLAPLEDVPAEWIEADPDAPLTLRRIWLGFRPLDRDDVGWILGQSELARQEALATAHHVETEPERRRAYAQGRAWAEAAE